MKPAGSAAGHSITPLRLERVLLVDDVSINRDVLRNLIEASVRQFDEAADGLEALELFKRHRYDAILLDIEMPRLDGYDTLRAMRAWERQHKLPASLVLAITTSDFPEDEQRAMAAGATAYLAKPVKKQELFLALHIHQAVPPASHPMAGLFSKLFAYAGKALDEIEAEDPGNLEAISKKIHELRGAMATYGFEDFAGRLKLIQLESQGGGFPSPSMFDELRNELQRLQGLSLHMDDGTEIVISAPAGS